MSSNAPYQIPDKPRLSSSIGLFSLVNIVVANMIGAGIFTTSGIIMEELQNPALLLLLWMAGGVIAFLGALSYGEIGANYPLAGGEYSYLTNLLHPLPGFLSGWISFIVGFSAPIAASALAFSEYFSRIVDLSLINENILVVKKLIAIGIILIFTGIHISGIKKGMLIQNILTMAKIAIILLILLLGFFYGTGSFEHFNTVNSAAKSVSVETIGLSLLWISFAYSGWNASSYIGSEIKDAQSNLPRSLIIGTLFVTVLYIGLNALYVYALDVEQMKGEIAIGGLALNKLFGQSFDLLFSAFIAFALLSSISSFIITGPRIYYAMALKRHFFKVASFINKKSVPSKSILIQSFLAVIYVLTGTFEQILTFLGISLILFPVLTVYTSIKLRKQHTSIIQFKGYPFVQIAFMTVSLLIFVTAYINRPVESTLAMAIILLGIPIFYFLQYKGSKTDTK